MIDSSTAANQVSCKIDEGVLRTKVDESETFGSSLLSETQDNVLVKAQLIGMDDNGEKARYEESEKSETGVDEVEDFSVQNVGEKKIRNRRIDQILSTNGDDIGTETVNEPGSLKGTSK